MVLVQPNYGGVTWDHPPPKGSLWTRGKSCREKGAGEIPSLRLKHSTWKLMVGRLHSFWGPAYFRVELLVVGSVSIILMSQKVQRIFCDPSHISWWSVEHLQCLWKSLPISRWAFREPFFWRKKDIAAVAALTCPPKKGIISIIVGNTPSNHWFSGSMLVSGRVGVLCFFKVDSSNPSLHMLILVIPWVVPLRELTVII